MMIQRPLGPRIAILKEGSEKKQGYEHAISNAIACRTIADAVRVTLGPLGNDVVLVIKRDKSLITNDGATILDTLDVQHPAAKLLVQMSKSQDKSIGDGTSSVVLLASEMLDRLTNLLSSQNSPHSIISCLNLCSKYSKEIVEQNTIDISSDMDVYLKKCANTSLSSKLISGSSDHFSQMAIEAIKIIGKNSSLKLVGIKNQTGGSISDSILIEGFALPKCFAYAGAKMQPYEFTNPKIALINIELELKPERVNSEVTIATASEYQAVVDSEWNILFEKLDKIRDSGANIVLSSLPVGDVAYQYFSDHGIYCGGRVHKDDMYRASLAFGANQQTTLDNIKNNLGSCGKFEEFSIGSERYIKFFNANAAKSCTIILRGVGNLFVDEAKRSLHDALKVIQNIYSNPKVVVGGGAIEMTLSAKMREWAQRDFTGKKSIFIQEIAKSFEIIPKVLADNCGYDQTSVLSYLRKLHNEGKHEFGININSESGTGDNKENGIFEPQQLTLHKLHTIFESITMLIVINQTIKAPKFQAESQALQDAKRAIEDKA
ncbi:MAG: hypothetical protein MHMPM18_000645 [Marteilia pararefringens]